MRLLHCLNSPKIGGIERLVINLAIEQKSKGIDVTIMLDNKDGQYHDDIIENNINLVMSNVEGGFVINPFKHKSLKRLFKKFDIIHFHHYSLIKSLAGLSSNTVYTIHGLSKGIRKENKIKYHIRETTKKFFLNRVDYFIANSKYTLRMAKKHYGLDAVKSQFILNGINIKSEDKLNLKRTKIGLTVGLVSRFVSRKRIDRLIMAFKYFIESGGLGELVLVGDGDTFDYVNELITSEGLNHSTKLYGYKSNVTEFYEKFDVCVFPSEKEPFGLVAVEAYLSGKPVIVFSDSGGLKEIIEPIEPENIVEDEKALANRLLYYSDNKHLIFEKADERVSYAQNNFSIKRMANEYSDVYKLILK